MVQAVLVVAVAVQLPLVLMELEPQATVETDFHHLSQELRSLVQAVAVALTITHLLPSAQVAQVVAVMVVLSSVAFGLSVRLELLAQVVAVAVAVTVRLALRVVQVS
jgi:hypothetical protein